MKLRNFLYTLVAGGFLIGSSVIFYASANQGNGKGNPATPGKENAQMLERTQFIQDTENQLAVLKTDVESLKTQAQTLQGDKKKNVQQTVTKAEDLLGRLEGNLAGIRESKGDWKSTKDKISQDLTNLQTLINEEGVPARTTLPGEG